jgi:RNA polymerase sigma factor (sigma-70 family)
MESLWNLARSGNNLEAINEVINELQAVALSGAKSRGSVSRRSDPEDAAQAALLYAYQQLLGGKFSEYTLQDFSTWLWRQGRDRATNEIRRHLRSSRSVQAEGGDVEFAPSRATSMVEVIDQIQEVLERFAHLPMYAEIIDMLGQGYTRPEIASKLGVTLEQVGCRIKKIRDFAAAS